MFKIDKSVIEDVKKSDGYQYMYDQVSDSTIEDAFDLDNCCIEVTRIIDGKYVSEILIPEEYLYKYPISVEEKLPYDFENDFYFIAGDERIKFKYQYFNKQLSQYSVDFQLKVYQVIYNTEVYLKGYNDG